MPVGPRTLVELTDFGMGQHATQAVFPDLLDQFHHIVVVADVHDLRDDPLGLAQSLIRRFPPDIFCGKLFDYGVIGTGP